MIVPTLCVGMRPARRCKFRLLRIGNAERHGLHSHAGAWEHVRVTVFCDDGRRLGARAAHDTFMHGPKSCRKNPKPAGLQPHVDAHSPQSVKRVAAVLINLPTNNEVEDSIHLGHLDIRLLGF